MCISRSPDNHQSADDLPVVLEVGRAPHPVRTDSSPHGRVACVPVRKGRSCLSFRGVSPDREEATVGDRLQEASLARQRHGLGAVVRAEFLEDGGNVELGRALRDEQPCADVPIGEARRHEPQDLGLP